MSNNTIGTCVDPNGRVYKTVRIKNQVWMAENLAYDEPGSKCYEDNPANSQIYGRLYKWETAVKLCPSGWHLPSDEEWQELLNAAGGEEIAGDKLKTERGWDDDKGKSGNGTDALGFSALGGGYCSPNAEQKFRWVRCDGRWWSRTTKGENHHALRLVHWSGLATIIKKNIKGWFCSVRYVQD